MNLTLLIGCQTLLILCIRFSSPHINMQAWLKTRCIFPAKDLHFLCYSSIPTIWNQFWSIPRELVTLDYFLSENIQLIFFQRWPPMPMQFKLSTIKFNKKALNYITEVDPDRKQAIAQRIVNLWAQLNILLQAPVPGFQGFQPHTHHPHQPQRHPHKYKVSISR